MLPLETAALAIVAVYVIFRSRREPGAGVVLARLALIAASGWAAEESCIRFYGFYEYSRDWSLFLGQVPVTVVLIWPAVIHSAHDLVSQMIGPQNRLVPLAAGAVVLTDAALIEPVAVHAGLWSWAEPGIFDVPPVGILGWSYFACLCTFLISRTSRYGGRSFGLLLAPLVVAAGVHIPLLATWWGLLRWINRPVEPIAATAFVWGLSTCLSCVAAGRRWGKGVRKWTLLLRLPGAVFFFGLLASCEECSGLVLYAIAFVPPYLVMMAHQYGMAPPKRKEQ